MKEAKRHVTTVIGEMKTKYPGQVGTMWSKLPRPSTKWAMDRLEASLFDNGIHAVRAENQWIASTMLRLQWMNRTRAVSIIPW